MFKQLLAKTNTVTDDKNKKKLSLQQRPRFLTHHIITM